MAEAGRVPPGSRKPDLTARGQAIIDGFILCNGSRPIHDGILLPIPISEFNAYFQIINLLDTDTRLDYIRFLQVCDTAYREASKSKTVNGDSGRQRQPSRGSNRRRNR